MCLAYNTKLFLLSGKEVTIEELYNSDYSNEWILACDLENKKVQPVKIQKVIQKDFIPDKLISITLDNGKTINVTDNHLILCRDGQYRRADELHEEDSLMPFDFYNEFRHKDYYRKVINPFGMKSEWIYKLVVHSLKEDEYNNVDMSDGSLYKVIHHRDHNKQNDNPDNLDPMSLRKHRKLHGDIFRRYNSSSNKRIRTSELANEGKVGWNYIKKCDPEKFKRIIESNIQIARENLIEYNKRPDIIKRNKERLENYSKSEKGRKKSSENGKKYGRLNFAKWNSSDEHRIQSRKLVNSWNNNSDIKEKQQIGKILKMYNIVKNNSELFERDNVTFEEFLSEVRRLKQMGIINKNSTFKQDYSLCIKAGIPITNHKIVRIERIRNNKPVYDLQLNEIHNFGIDAGIFVHNCDGLAGSLYNASISVKPEEMYNMEDYSVVMEVNPVSPFDISDNPANEMFDFVPKPKEQNTVVETDSFNDQINKDIENQNDIVKNLRDKLSATENRKVSDDELLGALFNKDDNIIIF